MRNGPWVQFTFQLCSLDKSRCHLRTLLMVTPQPVENPLGLEGFYELKYLVGSGRCGLSWVQWLLPWACPCGIHYAGVMIKDAGSCEGWGVWAWVVPPNAGCESYSLVPVLFPEQLCGLLWELLTPKREMPAVALCFWAYSQSTKCCLQSL